MPGIAILSRQNNDLMLLSLKEKMISRETSNEGLVTAIAILTILLLNLEYILRKSLVNHISR